MNKQIWRGDLRDKVANPHVEGGLTAPDGLDLHVRKLLAHAAVVAAAKT